MSITAYEINNKYGVKNHNAIVNIDGMQQNTIVYTLDDVNTIIDKATAYNKG